MPSPDPTDGPACIVLPMSQRLRRTAEVIACEQRPAIEWVHGRKLVCWVDDVTEATVEVGQRGTGGSDTRLTIRTARVRIQPQTSCQETATSKWPVLGSGSP